MYIIMYMLMRDEEERKKEASKVILYIITIIYVHIHAYTRTSVKVGDAICPDAIKSSTRPPSLDTTLATSTDPLLLNRSDISLSALS